MNILEKNFKSRLGRHPKLNFTKVNLRPEEAPSLVTPLEQINFVAFDCESAGSNPIKMIELGALAFSLKDYLDSFETLVKAGLLTGQIGTRIHKIKLDDLQDAPNAKTVARKFLGFSQNSVLIEHSGQGFDTRMVQQALGAELPGIVLDTALLAKQMWGLRDSVGLLRLCETLGVTNRRPHYALADAEATANCFIKLVAIGQKERGWQTLNDVLKTQMLASLPEIKGNSTLSSKPKTQRRQNSPYWNIVDGSHTIPNWQNEKVVEVTIKQRMHRLGRRQPLVPNNKVASLEDALDELNGA